MGKSVNLGISLDRTVRLGTSLSYLLHNLNLQKNMQYTILEFVFNKFVYAYDSHGGIFV